MIKPDLGEAKKLAANHTTIPIALELFADRKTPMQILQNMRKQSNQWFILESVNGGDNWGRYTFMGYKPVLTVYGIDGTVTVRNGMEKNAAQQDALAVLRDYLARFKSPRLPYLPPFTGGFVGYFAYDFVQRFIPGLKLNASNREGFRDFHLMLIDKVIAYDHFKQKIYVIINIPAQNIEDNYIRGVMELKDIERMLMDGDARMDEEVSACGEFTSLFPEREFTAMVNTVKKHIVEGDIFQAVLANRFQAPFKGSLMNTYRLLRTINPSPYMVHMRLDDMEIACSSPETLVALRDGEITSFPLAGTCPRGETDEQDAALIEALLDDAKELAEHDMLVDLARNDIGRVSSFNSVKVREYRQIKRFSHVTHISSRVTGKLRAGNDALDVIAATLPAGTLSGAPKKRACQIIDQAEGVKRGPYGGAIGYIDFAGNMDMCIGIRMAVLKDGTVYVQSGAGIVAESVPAREYRELVNKARALMETLQNSEEV